MSRSQQNSTFRLIVAPGTAVASGQVAPRPPLRCVMGGPRKSFDRSAAAMPRCACHLLERTSHGRAYRFLPRAAGPLMEWFMNGAGIQATEGAFAKPKRSHHARPPSSEEQRRKSGCAAITQFFVPPAPTPKAGRPAGLPPKKRGRRPAGPEVEVLPAVPEESVSVEPAPGPLGKRAAATMLGTKLKRVNWGKGEGLERMRKAVDPMAPRRACALERTAPPTQRMGPARRGRRGGPSWPARASTL
jgi:hypothetical protein